MLIESSTEFIVDALLPLGEIFFLNDDLAGLPVEGDYSESRMLYLVGDRPMGRLIVGRRRIVPVLTLDLA